ncbi:PTS lactose/cellobiose transporter subunit IIA [Fundicoccus culcitae]|uniref:PTS lactose/cellobiose transporter subunit IIA n=1 Tax=Fundicoccus culcitae TaxID=2969821 RepID=A0ABY5P9H2_9LACT|nr:PTS lactose/cellobiose transporter subunit IIA [Fundicoccus culcitae]UUX35406.1 PTS lactose/cellobiose transporter subunit IIA [Fundicoccus culcitae]
MPMDTQLELISMNLIANAGDARSYGFRALEAAKQGNFKEADDFLQKASEASNQAHQYQTDLLTNEANGEQLDINVLLIHAQDHLMTSMLAVELIKELVDIYRTRGEE